jgi:L-galactose dehydrogenase
LLSNRGTPEWHPASAEVKKVCAEAATYCREQGADIAKLALQFSLRNPAISTTLVGTADPNNLRNNVAWLDDPLDETLLKGVMQILSAIKDQTWMMGRPENN